METDIVPTMRSFPELVDIGIMGTCHASQHGICLASGVDCYQSAPIRQRANMTFDNYLKILKQCTCRTFQVALGGAGDPNKHENFGHILRATREYKIVPNLTTSGFEITAEEISLIKQFCGAVAVSYYSRLNYCDEETNPSTISAINKLIDSVVLLIFTLFFQKNIREAIRRMQKGFSQRDKRNHFYYTNL